MNSQLDFIIKNGTVVTEQGAIQQDVGIKDGKISILADTGTLFSADIIDAAGLLVLPGGIDTHVHFEDPGMTDWEDWEHGSMAAAKGGITTVVDMPVDNLPPTINGRTLHMKQDSALQHSHVDFALWGGLTIESKPEEMLNLGAIGLKAFLAECGGPFFPLADNGTLYEGLKVAAKKKKPVTVHCEDAEIVDYYTKQCCKQSVFSNGSWSKSRPKLAELVAVHKLLFLAELTHTKVNIAHISCHEVAELISEGKKKGIDVTAETCAHYLYFSGEDVLKRGTALKCSPPIRENEKEALWQCVKDGKIDFVASDHSPTSAEFRQLYADDMYRGAGGISGVQFTLNILFGEGVKKRALPLSRLAGVFSSNAARMLGLYGKKGAIAPGFDADFVLFDPTASWTVTEEDYLAKVKVSPYIGETLEGRVMATYLRGRCIYSYDNPLKSGISFAQMQVANWKGEDLSETC